ncbi:MAG: hypothetical protein JXB50_11605 [Spirochaetes bacterium]|nr:hypothetical protein [Spirochaetota bacterium]
MKKTAAIIILLNIFNILLFATDIKFNTLPKSIEEFLSLRDEIAKTPEGGGAMMVIALILYSNDENLGRQCLTVAVNQDQIVQGNYYKGYKLISSKMSLIESQISKQKYIPNSYINGTSPENNYELPKNNLSLSFRRNKYSQTDESGSVKVFVNCSGADSPRPITLKINDKGIWKAFEYSSLVVGIKKAKKEIKTDNL